MATTQTLGAVVSTVCDQFRATITKLIVTLLQPNSEARQGRERERGKREGEREREVRRLYKMQVRLMAPSKSHQEGINNIPLKIHYPLWQARGGIQI